MPTTTSAAELRRSSQLLLVAIAVAPLLCSMGVFVQGKRLAGYGGTFYAVMEGGDVFSCGSGDFGQNGDDRDWGARLPVQMHNINSAVDGAAGTTHACFVSAPLGAASCVGSGANGQLGNGAGADSKVLVPATGVEQGVAEVFCGVSSSFAIMAGTGQVYAWGQNSNGGLGTGDEVSALVPVEITALAGYNTTQVGAGYKETCYLTSTGLVLCSGLNEDGQLGNGGMYYSRHTPFEVDLAAFDPKPVFTSVSCDFGHCCATDSLGGVYCWGSNGNFQLGNSATGTKLTTPTPVSGISGAELVVAGRYNNFVLDRAARSAVAFGKDQYGVFGTGSAGVPSPSPVPFGQGVPDIVEIRGGFATACIMDRRGSVWCTGRGNYGTLGQGNTASSTSLVEWIDLVSKAPTTLAPTTLAPSAAPTSSAPTAAPVPATFAPSMAPTSSAPTQQPTSSTPTQQPTSSTPTQQPTSSTPTQQPTSSQPTAAPTSSEPTRQPSAAPSTLAPTAAPVPVTPAPSAAPTSSAPTAAPVPATPAPSTAPSSSAPTAAPAPTTYAPSTAPVPATYAPSLSPATTYAPSTAPVSNAPSSAPVAEIEATSAPTPPANTKCRLTSGTNKEECAKLSKTCAKSEVSMFWAGAGCRVNGKLQHDGGCQCKDYCGYTCSKACTLSSRGRCKWNKTLKVCTVAKTGKPYVVRDTMYCPKD